MKQTVAFRGVTRAVSDTACSDGDLAVAMNVCNDGGGVELLEKPQPLMELQDNEELLAVHLVESEERRHYITQIVNAANMSGGIQIKPHTPTSQAADDATIDNSLASGVIEESDASAEIDTSPYDRPDDADPYHDDDGKSTIIPGDTEIVPADADADKTVTPVGGIVEILDGENDRNGGNDNGGNDNGGTIPETKGKTYILCRVEDNAEPLNVIDITDYGRVTAIETVGNVLVVNHADAGIRYYLWDVEEKKYKGLGAAPPMVNIEFGLESEFKYYPKTKSKPKSTADNHGGYYSKYGGIQITSYPYTDTVGQWYNDNLEYAYVPPYDVVLSTKASVDGFFEHFSPTYSIDGVESPDGKTDVAGMKNSWTRTALGAYNKFIGDAAKDNKFVFPFYVRYALELYDGSLVMHSYPVLMIPNSRGPMFALDGKNGLKLDRDDANKSYEKVRVMFQGRVYGFESTLLRKFLKMEAGEFERLKNWKGLIRGLNIYITPPIYNYKQSGQVLGWRSTSVNDPANNGEDIWTKYYTVGKVKAGTKYLTGITSLKAGFTELLGSDTALQEIFYPYNGTYNAPSYILAIPEKDEQDVMDLHENAGQFYKLASVRYEELLELVNPAGAVDTVKAVTIRNNILNTISNQDVMQDDTGTHDTLAGDVLYGYNRRLNTAAVRRTLHDPILPNVQWAQSYASGSTWWQVTIYAKNGGRLAMVNRTTPLKPVAAGSTEMTGTMGTMLPLYIFYPGTEAVEAVIHQGPSIKYRVTLKEHKALNGMYWIADFLNRADSLRDFLWPAASSSYNFNDVNTVVDEGSKIYTSAVDNPFYVPVGNINIAGGGEVRALCSAVQALSQGQFGEHPMYCFTSEGVWALSPNDSGGWGVIQPVTRDVITAGTLPLSLDSAVVFLTGRGVLELDGAQVDVLSAPLDGKDMSALNKLGDIYSALGLGSLGEAAGALAGVPVSGRLAYDYINARVYVCVGAASWVYNLKSKLWTQAQTRIDRQIKSYPDCITQSGSNVVLLSVDRTDVNNRYGAGAVLTRPLKFGDAGLLKRVRELVVRSGTAPYGTGTAVSLWGCRDWSNGALMGSSMSARLTRMGGSGYFGLTVGAFLQNSAVSLVGADVDVIGYGDNKLR